MKVLPINFYRIPDLAKMTMTGEDLKELLLETNGQVLACGKLYEIKTKPLGAGVYKVWLDKEDR